MDWTVLDYVLFAVMAFVVGVGLFRGLSGELGSLAGFAAALAAGYFLYGVAKGLAWKAGLGARGDAVWTVSAAALDFVFALVAYGLVRMLVSKFVSFLLPQPANALLGALGGLFKSVVLLGLLTGVGMVAPGEYATGFCAAHSLVIRTIAGWADAYVEGARR
ncbi:MAG: CvpA family protein [Kiritimatiellia bacterium]